MTAMPATVFFGVWLSNRKERDDASPWKWTGSRATPREARDRVKAELREGNATMGFVVADGPDGKRAVEIYPMSVRDIIGHYLELLDILEG